MVHINIIQYTLYTLVPYQIIQNINLNIKK